MRIMCHKKLVEAMEHAIALDRARIEEILQKDDHNYDDVSNAAIASHSLMSCLAARLRTELSYNGDVGPRVVGDTGRRRLETFLFEDSSPYSFFFTEKWVDEDGVIDDNAYVRSWTVYASDGSLIKTVYTQAEADAADDEGLDVKFEKLPAGGRMCGGIIFHQEWKDGERTAFGSWSTHT